MFVLTAEEPGDYDDHYQRPLHVLKVSEDKEKLEAYWRTLPTRPKTDNVGHVTTYRRWNNVRLIEHYIEEVEVL